MEDKELKTYGLKELEKILGLSRVTLLKYCNAGTIKAVKVGSQWRVTHSNLEKYLNGEEVKK